MVLKKRLNYGFEGFCVPVIPRAPRSRRRPAQHKHSVEDSQICAIELLAAVAGKLLLDSESSSSSNVGEGKEHIDIHKDDINHEDMYGKLAKSDFLDQGSCVESESLPELALVSNEIKINKSKNAVVSSADVEDGTKRQVETLGEDTVDLNNTGVRVNRDSNVKLPLYKTTVPNAYLPGRRKNVNICTRDDDEKSFRFNKLNMRRKPFKQQSCIRYRRIRNMVSSRYWKAAAAKFRDYKLSETGREMKPFFRNRKRIYTQERCQLETIYKRRKMFENRYNHEGSSGSISNSPEKSGKGVKCHSAASLHRGGVTSPSIHHKSPFQSKDRHGDDLLKPESLDYTKHHRRSHKHILPLFRTKLPMKLCIKSFGVPELYIEVPESVTVGSLKRTVMDAVTALLGGELHVGLLVQGKKIRDDNRTLQQTGITQDDELDNLGFILEPTATISQTSSPISHKDFPFLQSCDSYKQSSRCGSKKYLDSDMSNPSVIAAPLATKIENHEEDIVDIVPISTNLPTEEKIVLDSKALVCAPPLKVEALSAIPLDQKYKRSELSQRRTRRPFSVSEVESLVEAVEKLGTGRWRDVKMRAFDDANHRTYVDLKDKWKTLVHTASIAPQQRRGQPVPQELLDRVLAAHSQWSLHQSKQQHVKTLVESPNKLSCGDNMVAV